MNKLFSYGTLQIKQVQIHTFGRKLSGSEDRLQAYGVEDLKIRDSLVVKSGGTDTHLILVYTGKLTDYVKGTIYELTDEEILQADKYEVDDYKRSELTFESGIKAFVYLRNNK